MSVETLIQQANAKAEKGRKKVYVKKASDSQLLALMQQAATKALSVYRESILANGETYKSGPFADALRELRLLTDVVEKRSR
jgi:hypothetical protein